MKNNFLLLATILFIAFGAQAQLTNNGASITVKEGAVLSVDGNFDNKNSGVVQGNGQITMISGQFNNEAELAPGLSIGLIDIAGPLVQAVSGSKTIEVGGNNGAGIDPDGHDQVSMITDLTLNGTLDVALSNNFDPSVGDSNGPYTLANFSGTVSGTYASINLPSPEMDGWLIDYGTLYPNTITLYAPVGLPVEWLEFIAERENNFAMLYWKTATETDNLGFNVEHSLNGSSWSKIGWVPGSGNSQQVQDYDYIHETPVNGDNLYRLKQIDTDRTFNYSEIRIVYFALTSEVVLFPNPATTNIVLELPDGKLDAKLNIYNANGKLIKSIDYTNGSAIDVANLAAGTYLIEVSLDKEKIIKKFVKQ